VGILVKKTLNFNCLGSARDEEADNYLLLLAEISSVTVILGSIYGPNDTDVNFFRRLEASISGLGRHPVILGGDWNSTPSCLPLRDNPDVLNMQALPNITHSRSIQEMCDNI